MGVCARFMGSSNNPKVSSLSVIYIAVLDPRRLLVAVLILVSFPSRGLRAKLGVEGEVIVSVQVFGREL